MFGKLDCRVGIFPADYVEPMSRSEARKHAQRQVSRMTRRLYIYENLSIYFLSLSISLSCQLAFYFT